MRYVYTGDSFYPKHCKYGPRPVEGLVLGGPEWWTITDHLVKEEREREISAVQKAKEEAKKDVSFQMTRNWNNTLASVKTLSDQKRVEKRNKEKQDKIDKYNEILKNREEERRQVLEGVKKIFSANKDSTNTIKSGILYSLVIAERQKQIEAKNAIRREEVEKNLELGRKYRREAEELKREKFNEKNIEKNKRKMQRELLDKQMDELKQIKKAEEEEKAREKEDLINMKVELDKIQRCNNLEKKERREYASNYARKTQNQLDHEKRLVLENEEEDEINRIYLDYAKRFQKERKERECQLANEKIEMRLRVAHQLGIKILEATKQEQERLETAEKEKLSDALVEEERKETARRKALAEILEEKKKGEEKIARNQREAREAIKWEMIQSCRTAEVNAKWREDLRRKKKEKQTNNRLAYDEQRREKEETRLRNSEEEATFMEDDEKSKEDELKACEEALNFVRKQNLPLYPVVAAIAKVKKSNGTQKEKEMKVQNQPEDSNCLERMAKRNFINNGCYFFKC